MTIIYAQDILPILITTLCCSAAATAHRILLPTQYSSFLQFKGEEDEKRSVHSTFIRIAYLMIITIVLHLIGFTERQILIGIFIACFLNVWPAIIEYHLLKIEKPRVGSAVHSKKRTVLIYSAVLRSVLTGEGIYYSGSE